jgi:hypothetical protein
MNFKFHDSKGDVKRFLGVEMEVSHIGDRSKVAKVVEKWGGEVGSDGSIDPEDTDIGNRSCGDTAEIRTAPARGELFEQQIKEICEVLVATGGKVNESCGLHVHVDARDFNSDDIFKTVLVWEKYESQMFQKVAKHRRDNDYCEAIGDTFASIVRGDGFPMVKLEKIKNEWQDLDKHCSLNLINLEHLGTIENRMHEGTIDAEKIIAWGKLNSKLIDFCKKSDLKSVTNMKAFSTRSLGSYLRK